MGGGLRHTLIRSACMTCLLMAAGAVHVRAAPGPTSSTAGANGANAGAGGAVAANRDVGNLLASAVLWQARHRNDLARAALEKALKDSQIPQKSALPDQAEIDRSLSIMEQMMRRFMGLAQEWSQEHPKNDAYPNKT